MADRVNPITAALWGFRWTGDAAEMAARLEAELNRMGYAVIEREAARPSLDVEQLARAIQSTILTSPDKYTGPGMGAYRTAWDDLAPEEQRHVIGDAKALAAEYDDLASLDPAPPHRGDRA